MDCAAVPRVMRTGLQTSDREFVLSLRTTVDAYLAAVDRWELAYHKYYRMPDCAGQVSADMEAEQREFVDRRRELEALVPRSHRLCLKHRLTDPFSGLLRISLGQFAPQHRTQSAIGRGERNTVAVCLMELHEACSEWAESAGACGRIAGSEASLAARPVQRFLLLRSSPRKCRLALTLLGVLMTLSSERYRRFRGHLPCLDYLVAPPEVSDPGRREPDKFWNSTFTRASGLLLLGGRLHFPWARLAARVVLKHGSYPSPGTSLPPSTPARPASPLPAIRQAVLPLQAARCTPDLTTLPEIRSFPAPERWRCA